MQIRYSGLPNNATLEMSKAATLRVESAVTVVINLENGTRLTGEFLPSGENVHFLIIRNV